MTQFSISSDTFLKSYELKTWYILVWHFVCSKKTEETGEVKDKIRSGRTKKLSTVMSLRNRNKCNKDLKQDLKDAPGASVDPSFSKASSEMVIMKGRQWRRETGKSSCGMPNYTRKSYDNRSYGVMNANFKSLDQIVITRHWGGQGRSTTVSAYSHV